MAYQGKPGPKTQWLPIILSLVVPIIVTVGWRLYDNFSKYFELLTDKQIDIKLNPIAKEIDTNLNNLGRRVATREGQLSILVIQKLAMEPKKAVNAKQTSELLKTAKKDGTRLDPELITVAGKEFITAGGSNSDPAVWDAALGACPALSDLHYVFPSFAPAHG